MSLISEQVRQLKELSDSFYRIGNQRSGDEIANAAATIQGLVDKLHTANMERSSMYYHGGWIPVSGKLPDKDGWYITTFDGDIYGSDGEKSVGMTCFEDGDWIEDKVYAWMPLPTPYTESSNRI